MPSTLMSFSSSQDLHISFAKRLRKLLELRSPEIVSHLANVAQDAKTLASYIGWSEEKIALVNHAAPLHDLGKLLIPRKILEKPAKLNADEFTAIQSHTLTGWEVLSDSEDPLFQMAANMARYHHERWDGAGYPDGLAGDEIPIEARLIAIPDVYDSLISNRCYRAAMSEVEVINIIKKDAGKAFDPTLVEAFLALHATGKIHRFNEEVAS